MPNEIHVERPGEWEEADYDAGSMHFTLEEWLAAVATAPGARLVTGRREIGPRITVESGPGDVELYFDDRRGWVTVFHTYPSESGRVSISTPTRALEEPVVLAFLRHVTTILGAIVTGDEGEHYNLHTGEPIAAK